MTVRMYAASLAAIVGIASVVVPVETSAGTAKFAGRSATSHGGFRAPAVRSSAPAPVYVVNEPETITVRVVPAIYDYRLGCQSQTQNVATSGGGERAITIMRC